MAKKKVDKSVAFFNRIGTYDQADNKGGGHKGRGHMGGFKDNHSAKDPYAMGISKDENKTWGVSVPYNFIPLNKEILKHPLTEKIDGQIKDYDKALQDAYFKYLTEEETFTGYVKIKLTNKTPLYIAGKEGMFTDGKNVCIPGSSLRGTMKNIFKIITNSSFRIGKVDSNSKDGKDNPDASDRKLYYRVLFAKAGTPQGLLQSAYQAELAEVRGKDTLSKATAGFIVQEGTAFKMYPAKRECLDSYKRLKYKDSKEMENKAGQIHWAQEYVDVHTGKMRNKERFYRIQFDDIDWNRTLHIDKRIIEDYIDDISREKTYHLVLRDEISGKTYLNPKRAKKISTPAGEVEVVPCFYKTQGGAVKHFGAGPLYRMPFEKSISDHVPKNIKGEKDIDFTDALFGNKEHWASRISFEDAYLVNKQPKWAVTNPTYVRPMLGPKATSYQFYLEPNKANPNHWNLSATIRGYKMYWHKEADWKAKPEESKDSITKKIKPLEQGMTFETKVHFKQLTKAELGAFMDLFSYTEKNGLYIKLGMGKPLGLGSVGLDCEFFIQEKNAEQTRYTKLFDDKGFYGGYVSLQSDKGKALVDQCDKAFKKVLSDQWIKYPNEESIYKNRIASLKEMLSMRYMKENKERWRSMVSYMKVGSIIYRDKYVLPTVVELVEKFKKG